MMTLADILSNLKHRTKSSSRVFASVCGALVILQRANMSNCVVKLRAVQGQCSRNLSQENASSQETFTSQQTSTNSDNGEDMEIETREKILRASLPFVHQHGWTQNALVAGAEAEGLPGVAHGLFPRGGVELVYFFYTDCNRQLGVQLAEQVKQADEEQATEEKNKSGSKIRPLIRGAVETRLRMLTPYIDTWPQAMAILALPQNAPEALSNLLKLTDEIWYYAGDRSTDFNWYTKRVALAGVYKATEVFMVQDKSEDYEETWGFLDRRMADFTSLGKVSRMGSQTSSVFSEACKGIFIVGKNMMGANARAR